MKKYLFSALKANTYKGVFLFVGIMILHLSIPSKVAAQQCAPQRIVNQYACTTTSLSSCKIYSYKCAGDLSRSCLQSEVGTTCTNSTGTTSYGKCSAFCEVFNTGTTCAQTGSQVVNCNQSSCSWTGAIAGCSGTGDSCIEKSDPLTYGCYINSGGSTGPTDAPTTVTPGTWSGCGDSCACGHPGECVTDPNGACLWDPGSCGNTSAPPPPPPPPSAACGESCSDDATCQRRNSASHCYQGKCQRIGCDGQTGSGANCPCNKPAACGDRCGLAYGKCVTGSTCGFLTTPTTCAQNENSSSVQRCLPDSPKGFYTEGRCTNIAADYLINPDGSTPASASGLLVACTAPPPINTIKVCHAIEKDNAYLSSYSGLPSTTFLIDIGAQFVDGDIANATFSTSDVPNESVAGIPVKCQTFTDVRDNAEYSYSTSAVSPYTGNWSEGTYNDDYPVTNATPAKFGETDYSDSIINFGVASSAADLNRTLIVVDHYSDVASCDNRVYQKITGSHSSTDQSASFGPYTIPDRTAEGLQAIGAVISMGDGHTGYKYRPNVTSQDGAGTTAADTNYYVVTSCREASQYGARYIDVCTTAQHWITLDDQPYNSSNNLKDTPPLFQPSLTSKTRNMRTFGITFKNGVNPGDKISLGYVNAIYKPLVSSCITRAEITSSVYLNPGTVTTVGALDDAVCTSGAASTFGQGTVTATDPVGTTFSADVHSNGSYLISNLDDSLKYSVTYSPPPGYQCICPIGCTYSNRSAPPKNANGTAQDLRFYVTPSALGWYQTRGGEIAALRKSSTSLTNSIPSTCSGGACSPYLSLPFTAGDNTTAASLTVGTSSTVDIGAIAGAQTNMVSPGTNHLVYTSATTCRENYSYFYRLYSMGLNPSDDFATPTNVTKPTIAPLNGKNAYFYSGDLTIDNDWSVGSTESIVVFVNGDLKIDKTITVAPGGFLAFIVSGNITVDDTVGTATFSSTTPGQVQGVYVANGIITVESSGTAGTEKKFIGEGVFAACNGIKLPRDFSNGSNGVQNNTYPASLFIFRPDFLLSTPARMKVPQTNWKEVSP